MKPRTSIAHQKRGMTARRSRVLELISSNPKPSKAYDLFFRLQTDFPRITPATVYRTLAWLESRGLVKKIESMHAYVGSGPGARPGHVTFICDTCNRVAGFEDVSLTQVLVGHAKRLGFELHREIIEAHGACPSCRSTGAARSRKDLLKRADRLAASGGYRSHPERP